jgi:(p)ppGpp synthase/HD superfamily hydrolase
VTQIVRKPGSRLDAALRLALAAHEGQLRKDRRTPYLVHPLAVLRYLSTDLGVTDPNVLSAAVLHDVIEDTGVSARRLARKFGRTTIHLVEELTLPPQLHGPRVSDRAKTDALVRAVGSISWTAVLIKLCDRWDNLRDVPAALWSKTKRRSFRSQTAAILGAITQRWKDSPPPQSLRPALRKAMAGVRAQLRRRALL